MKKQVRRMAVGVSIAAVAAIGAPAAADASNVYKYGADEIRYHALPGEDNDLKITADGGDVCSTR